MATCEIMSGVEEITEFARYFIGVTAGRNERYLQACTRKTTAEQISESWKTMGYKNVSIFKWHVWPCK